MRNYVWIFFSCVFMKYIWFRVLCERGEWWWGLKKWKVKSTYLHDADYGNTKHYIFFFLFFLFTLSQLFHFPTTHLKFVFFFFSFSLKPSPYFLILIPSSSSCSYSLLLLLIPLFYQKKKRQTNSLMSNSEDKSSMADLVQPSEHFCYVQCNFCNTVLAVYNTKFIIIYQLISMCLWVMWINRWDILCYMKL